ncbi:hypothetical protein L950_0229870 [Sphingobacterium sp. IITKGP-BTPF85]|nr:hypothetical protein L950_0229870 [Sphingobacterium sp. IITKGP-BTPF85]
MNADLQDDDGDGVANKFDKCPGTPSGVQVDGAGCPILVKNETKIVEKLSRRRIEELLMKQLKT